MSDTMDSIPVRHETLEKIRFTLKEMMSKQFIESMVDIGSHGYWNHILIELTGVLFGQRLQRYEVKFPRDWWQAFKERWFPYWARKRWPVIYTVRKFDVASLYPDYKPAIPGQRVTLAILEMGIATYPERES